jgi:hypothetical protein
MMYKKIMNHTPDHGQPPSERPQRPAGLPETPESRKKYEVSRLADRLTREGRFDAAIVLHQIAAEELRGQEAHIMAIHHCHQLAEIYLRQDRLEEALAMLRQAESIGLEPVTYQANLRIRQEILRKQGESGEAAAVGDRLERMRAHRRRQLTGDQE